MASLVVLKGLNAQAEHWTENTGEVFNRSISRTRGLFSLGHDYLSEWNFAVLSRISSLFGVVRVNSSLWTYPRDEGDEGKGKSRLPPTASLQNNNLINATKEAPLFLAGCKLGISLAMDSSDKSVCCIHGTGSQSIPLHSTHKRCSSPSLPALQGTALCSPRQSLSQGRMKHLCNFLLNKW